MRKNLVLVGGGHAHMVTLEQISTFVDKGHKVTVIAPSFYHYYSGMGPGMLGLSYTPDQIRFATQKVVTDQGGVFVKDRVVRIDPKNKTVFTGSGHEFPYDVISFNAGSHVPMASVVENADNIYPVKPIEKLRQASEKLVSLFKKGPSVVSVVGGGPSSAEVAGNVWQLARKTRAYQPKIRIYAGKLFMSRFVPGIRDRVCAILEKRGIDIIESGYVEQVTQDKIHLDSGDSFETDFTFMALGVTPSSIFEDSSLPMGPDKGLMVNKYLQSPDYPEIFGGGDCIYHGPQPLDKVGVYAVRENPVLCHNLMAALDEKPLHPFDPGGDYLLIFNLGGGQGVLKKRNVMFKGRLAFWIKDYIDRKFIRRFQAMEREAS